MFLLFWGIVLLTFLVALMWWKGGLHSSICNTCAYRKKTCQLKFKGKVKECLFYKVMEMR